MNSNHALIISRITQNQQFGLLEFEWEMKSLTSSLVAALLLVDLAAGHVAVRIADDRRGQIGKY
jgi:hypothetical protein